MSDFFDKPILNSPYDYPGRHWSLDESGHPTGQIVDTRRKTKLITPVPKPRRRDRERGLDMETEGGVGATYDPMPIIGEIRRHVDQWRECAPKDWGVTPETARLLDHWRNYKFQGIRPFFCQVEAAETAIWLTEIAPKFKEYRKYLDHLERANEQANPGLNRLALKLATGAGKTTVMAMLIAWQTVNAVRRPTSRNYTNGFLLIAPGIAVRDRLRVLKPNAPDSYYGERELVPRDMLADLQKARIVITNYHAFKLRETLDISAGGRALIKGRNGNLKTLETEGQMLRRVVPELMGMKGIMVINDEAHHCYREKPPEEDEPQLRGEEKKDAEENNDAARLWISGIEAISRSLGVRRVIDLSATPFFLRGSGYEEGSLFPWTMSDFSLMDAIECGIVKLPRVPVTDNLMQGDQLLPMYRNLWDHIRTDMPKKGRGKAAKLDPTQLPVPLITALDALYGHYKTVFDSWRQHGMDVPPCFIVVCNNTASSKLVYDFISGYMVENEDGEECKQGHLELFRNFTEHDTRLPLPRTLLVDSRQLESGEALDSNFRKIAADQIEQLKKEMVQRTGDQRAGDKLTDADLIREALNTVGKKGKLGEDIRCVVSVSMLTEGWDANNVTHILGVRAFGTQLLCEQVIGRALRRQSYELNEDGKFNAEYADVLGIPFDFTAKPVKSKLTRPRESIYVSAVSPERDHLEIRFPRVTGYWVELPRQRLKADFNLRDHRMELSPDLVGATETKNSGIIGEQVDLTVQHLEDTRHSTIIYNLAQHVIFHKWREDGKPAKSFLFNDMRRIARQWLAKYLVCRGNTYPAQLRYRPLADMAAEKITRGIVETNVGESPVKAVVDPYNPVGSTKHVGFNTSREVRWQTDERRCHVNWAIPDSEWETEFCRIVESHPQVRAYVKNHGLGFEVPYRYGTDTRTYLPDFIVLIDDGHGDDDLLNLIVEVKGYRREDAVEKKGAMDTYWIPGVNNLKRYGRWAFAELTEAYNMQADLQAAITSEFDRMVKATTNGKGVATTEAID